MPDKLTVFLQEIGTGISKDTVEKFAKSGEPDLPNLPHTKEFIRNVVELGKSFEEEIDIKKLRDSFNSENYKDLTNYEKVLAMKKASVKAELITEKHDSHLLNLVKEVCSEIDYKNNSPRIIVCQSDFPFAGGATKLNGDSIVMLSSAIIDLLDKNELKAVIGHELDHVEDTSKQTFGAVGHYIKGQFTGGRTLREAEFNADSRGAETEGGAAALKSALIKVTKRNQEISDFVHNFTASANIAISENGLIEKKALTKTLEFVLDTAEDAIASSQTPTTHPHIYDRIARLNGEKPPKQLGFMDKVKAMVLAGELSFANLPSDTPQNIAQKTFANPSPQKTHFRE